jgi:hypothetical protein
LKRIVALEGTPVSVLALTGLPLIVTVTSEVVIGPGSHLMYKHVPAGVKVNVSPVRFVGGGKDAQPGLIGAAAAGIAAINGSAATPIAAPTATNFLRMKDPFSVELRMEDCFEFAAPRN